MTLFSVPNHNRVPKQGLTLNQSLTLTPTDPWTEIAYGVVVHAMLHYGQTSKTVIVAYRFKRSRCI